MFRSKKTVRKIAASQKAKAKIISELGVTTKKKNEWGGCKRKISTSPRVIIRRKKHEVENEQN